MGVNTGRGEAGAVEGMESWMARSHRYGGRTCATTGLYGTENSSSSWGLVGPVLPIESCAQDTAAIALPPRSLLPHRPPGAASRSH